MQNVTLENYSDIRDRTRKISEDIRCRIGGHLETVKTHFRSGPVFGSYVLSGSKLSGQENPRNASAAFAQLMAFFKQIAVSTPFNLDPKLPDAIEISPATPVLCPFMYQHQISTPAGTKPLIVTTPFRFVLAFPEYSFGDLRGLISSRGPKDKLREFVLHYIVLNYVVMQNKRLLSLFEDMRFPIRSECFEEFGALPITTISAPATSVRSSDAVVAQICKFSGTDTAEELADFENWNRQPDPLAELFQEEAAKVSAIAGVAT